MIGSWFLPLALFQTVMNSCQQPSNWGCRVALRPTFSYRGNGGVRVKLDRGCIYHTVKGGKKVNCSSCRVRGQKSKLSYRHLELGAIKVKKLGMLRPTHYFFIFFVFGKGKEKNSLPFIPFHWNIGNSAVYSLVGLVDYIFKKCVFTP